MTQTAKTNCPSCGYMIAENYCPNCGEKKRTAHDLSMKHFIEETVEGISHFDGRFFRTIKTLFSKPGLLTLQFEQGRRVPYMKPFQLFIVANLVFFLIAHGPNLFATGLSSFYNYDNYTKYGTRKIIDSKLASHTDEAFIELAKVFNEKMITQSKVFIMLFIPVLGLVAGLLYSRTKKHLSTHLVFATHFFSFVMLYFVLFFLLIEAPGSFLFNLDKRSGYDAFVGIFSISIFVIYLTIAAKRFYNSPRAWCIFSSLVIAGTFLAALSAYRLLLFFKIINSI